MDNKILFGIGILVTICVVLMSGCQEPPNHNIKSGNYYCLDQNKNDICDDKENSGFDVATIMDNAIDAYYTLNTVQMDADAEFNMKASGKNMKMKMKTSNQKTDFKARRMYTPLTFSVYGAGLSDTYSLDIYAINSTMYMKMMGEWVKDELTAKEVEEMWGNTTIQQDIELLTGSTIKYMGDETIRGSDCWKISIIPDNKKMEGYINKVMESSSTGQDNINYEIEFKKDGLKTFNIWIRKDDYFIAKEEVIADFELKMKEYGRRTITASTNMKVYTEMYDHNEKLSITLPSSAEYATDIDATIDTEVYRYY